ncbi:DUF86 domain-containing protein [Pseudoclavibacter sp. VKM Ac-2888]|nr:DUF86 domain-containing protein [Pseudoclavibacter sp. VKM Ac-2888]
MLAAIDRCQQYLPWSHDQADALEQMAFDAISRNLQILGDAANDLPEEFTASIPGIAWAEIRGLRNILVHEYFRVQPQVLFDVVEHRLPDVAAELRRATGS